MTNVEYTSDRVNVAHGRWLFAGGHFTCSECGYCPLNEVIFCGVRVWWKDIMEEMHYCPHCGARMDGERRDT